MTTENKTMPRTLTGSVVSDKMQDTIVVLVERQVKHPKYRKFIRRSTKLHAHDAGNSASIGDFVVVQECPPLSKTKCWKLLEIRKKSEG
jgi:small subunit ribosomal protein S17